MLYCPLSVVPFDSFEWPNPSAYNSDIINYNATENKISHSPIS